MNYLQKSVSSMFGLLALMSFMFLVTVTVRADETKPGLVIGHDPLEYYLSGHRILISARVTDPVGVSIVRCYFRAQNQADFVFIDLETGKDGLYNGYLPSPAPETETIDYSILAVNNEQAVFKTKIMRMTRRIEDDQKLPAWQSDQSEGSIILKTELAEAPETLPGFQDNLTLDVVESSLRFGGAGAVVALSSLDKPAISAHWLKEFMTSSGKKAWYKQWWVWTGVAVVAGGTAMALSQDSGSDDDNATVTVSW
ncbi:hypothetical protein JXQ70_15000 [bacterium]|nr:hypothetical protein [bacterium]